MDPPADGDELARVVPLRRRDRDHAAPPGARGALPRERAPFDPEIEPPDTLSRAAAGVALRSTHSALRLRRAPGPRQQTRAVGSRRPSRTMILTGAGGVGLATVATLALLGSALSPSPSSPAATIGSPGSPVAAGALEPTTLGLLSTAANPFDVRLDTAARTGRTDAVRAHHAPPKPSRKPSAPTRSHTRASTTTTDRSAVAASDRPATSETSSHNATTDTQRPEITTAIPPPVQPSTSQQSTSGARPASSSASTTNRPDFGEQGLLGPGSSPDS
jgi:hypothetical protein